LLVFRAFGLCDDIYSLFKNASEIADPPFPLVDTPLLFLSTPDVLNACLVPDITLGWKGPAALNSFCWNISLASYFWLSMSQQ
jgi:hypothetical protein